LRHGSTLLRGTKQIVEIFDQADFPGRQAQPAEADERVELRPADRLDREASAPARREPAKGIPDVLQLKGQIGRRQLGLILGALLRLERRPIEQALQDPAVGNAILQARQLKGLFGEGPQLVAEG
jgi:hypothetical protein